MRYLIADSYKWDSRMISGSTLCFHHDMWTLRTSEHAGMRLAL